MYSHADFLSYAGWDFGHADFADDADFFGLTIFYIPQISQIYTDFSSDNSAKSYVKKDLRHPIDRIGQKSV